MLEDYAKANGFTNCVHFTDDGWSGGSFDRPSWKRMIEGIEKGEIAAVLVKDLSRVGRDYLQVGFYTEVMFREKGVRFIAITNGVDSDKRESSEFAPFLNIMNEWYIRDCSRKITTVLRARGMSGKHTSNHCIYGYRKDPNNKDHWIIDEEAAEVVRRIYRMAIEGKGPYEIARILATEKVERPSYYLAQRGMGNHQSNYNAADPYTWRGGTVADILSKQEYMGHTVNFRTYKESYKDKRVKMTPKEDLVIFENTQEAIIDKETWERVQTLRKTIRRTDSIGKANPLTGLMFCADCGAKMYNHRGKAGNARDWAGRPNGKKRPDRDEYNCSRYDLGNQHYDKYCTTHLIRTAVVNELLLEAIKGVCDYALSSEAEFMAQVCSASEARQEKAARAIRQRKQRNEKRTDELTRLIRKLYEDNVSGRLSDTIFEQMLSDFEAELSDLTEIISQDQQELERISRETINAEKFLSLVRKYTDFSELTPAMINEFVEKILVHQAQGKGKQELFLEANIDELKTLLEVALIQSTGASNRIEGIYTTDKRLEELVSQKAEPRNRSEQEISGYREVLSTIHESYEYIVPRPNIILQLHRDLYSYAGSGGEYKNADNVIAETDAEGHQKARFIPVPAFQTAEAMDELCRQFLEAWNTDKIDKLLLIPMFSGFPLYPPFQ